MLSLVHRSPFPRVFLVLVFVLSGSISAVRAATPTPTPPPGRLDTTFVPAPGTSDAVNVVIPQPDGKVIAAGRFTFANNIARNRIARFNFDGSLDTTFDPGTGADGEITAAVDIASGEIASAAVNIGVVVAVEVGDVGAVVAAEDHLHVRSKLPVRLKGNETAARPRQTAR